MADRKTPMRDGRMIVIGVAAATLIEAGKLVAVSAAGYAVPAADTAGLKVMGRAAERVDNTAGAAGDLSVEIDRQAAFLLKISTTSPVAQADIGSNVMVEDAATVAKDTTNDIVAGKLLGFESGGAWVEVQ